MSTSTARKIPTPLYAAAGAGDLAYQQLRKLPEQLGNLPDQVAKLPDQVTQLRGRVAELPDQVTQLRGKVADANLTAEVGRLRRNAGTLLANAQEAASGAQTRAVAVYQDLVVRGRKVVRGTGTDLEPAHTRQVEPAHIEPAHTEPVQAVHTVPDAAATTHRVAEAAAGDTPPAPKPVRKSAKKTLDK